MTNYPSPTFQNVTIQGTISGGLSADLILSYIGQPANSQRLYRAYVGHPFTLPAGLPLSTIACRVAPTANWTVTISYQGTQIGTGTILAGQTVGSFSFPAGILVASGQLLEVDAPATADVTIQDPSITLAGTR